MSPAGVPGAEPDSLALLLLRGPLEGSEFEAHAQSLLSIPRVLAVEAARVRVPRLVREGAAMRQARRLRFPGRVRLLVLYSPAQYALARGLGQYHGAELWYVESDPGDWWYGRNRELQEADQLARARAAGLLPRTGPADVDDRALRARLHELDVISAYAFLPDARPWARPPRRRGRRG